MTAADRESALVQCRRHAPRRGDDGPRPAARPGLGVGGIQAARGDARLDPDIKVIVLTGQNDRPTPCARSRSGAYDFFAKPFEPELLRPDDRPRLPAAATAAGKPAAQALHQPDALGGPDDARSRDAADLPHDREGRATRTSSVLLLGESGTGKEVLAQGAARQRRKRSGRVRRDQLRRDPREPARERALRLREGAFTGAGEDRRVGKIETANGGTLMLDEIGDLPYPLQVEAAALPAGARGRARRRPAGDCRSTCASSARRTRT